MKLTILIIENRIVKCKLGTGMLLDIYQRWFTDDIQEGDALELDVHDKNESL